MMLKELIFGAPESVPQTTIADNLHQFTLEFFTHLQAQTQRLDDRPTGPVRVTLDETLQGHFGQPVLMLCFQHSDTAAGYELVAHGSRIFDHMMAYLQLRSAMTVQNLPKRFVGGEELLGAIRPLNASIADLRMAEQTEHLVVFHWRITYRAEDKHEEVYTVILDAEGQRLLTTEDTHGSGPEINNGGTNNGISDNEVNVSSAINLTSILADAEDVPPQYNEDGHPLPPRLLPMTQLTRLAETARKYAIYHADVRCVSHEAEIYPRLYKALNRLTNYYNQQIEEVYDAHDPDGEKREALEVDLQRKIAEEVENHRLRVQVDLNSYAILQIPMASAEILMRDVMHDNPREAKVRVQRNRYTGQVTLPACYACQSATAQVTLDRHSHITCNDCVEQCASCQDILCASCGITACPVCDKEICESCGQSCWACGERACHEHISTCPLCDDMVCHSCQDACSHCDTRQCRSHLRADCVTEETQQSQLICATCAVRCPGCEQYSARVDSCTISGQQFCANCLQNCVRCGNQVGLGLYQLVLKGALGEAPGEEVAYCINCLIECPDCGALTPETQQCARCQTSCCHSCGQQCAVCQQFFCLAHAEKVGACGHVVCDAHGASCAIGQEAICPVCEAVCAICDRYYCSEHATTCRRCEREYCSECIRISDICDTCATISRDGEAVDIATEPWAEHPEVAPLVGKYKWLRAGNQRYTIYFGENALMASAIVVIESRPATHEATEHVLTERGPTEYEVGGEAEQGRVVCARKLGMVQSIRRKLWG